MSEVTPRPFGRLGRVLGYLQGRGGDGGVQGAVRDAFVWNTLNTLLSQSVSLGVFLWLAALLPPIVFGVFALALLVVDLFSMQLKAAASDAIVQAKDFSAPALSSAFFALCPICLACPLVAWALGDWAAAAFAAPALAGVLPGLALSIVFVPVIAVCEALVIRSFGYRTLALRNMGGVLIGAAAALAVAFSPAAEWALVAQRLVQSVFAAAFLLAHTRWAPALIWNPAATRRFTAAASQMWMAQVLAVASGRVGAALIGLRLGADVLGLVRVAGRFVETLHQPLTSPVSSLLIPALAKVREDMAQTRRLFLELVGLSALISVPAFVGLALVARDLTALTLTKAYAGAGMVLALTALINAWTPLSYFRDGVLSGLGRNGLRLGVSLGDVVTLGLALWIGSQYGLFETLLAGLAQAAAVAAVTVLLLGAVLQLPPGAFLRAAAPAYVAAAGMAGAVLLFQAQAQHWPGLVRLIASGAVGGCVYAGIVGLCFRAWALRALDMLRGRGRF